MARLDLTKKPKPVTDNIVPQNRDGLPYKPGQILLPPSTKAELAKLGWKEGDPLPKELADKLAEFQAQLADKDREDVGKALSDVAAAQPTPARPRQVVDIEALPPERQQELKDLLKQAKQTLLEAPAAAPSAPVMAGVDPSINAALSAAYKAANEEPESSSGPAVTAGPEPAPASLAIPDAAPQRCPRCQLDLRLPYEVEISLADKRAFVESILSGKRFYKDYPLFGGQVCIQFRTLTGAENALIFEQLQLDARAEKLAGVEAWYQQLVVYRSLLSLSSVTNGLGITQLPIAADIEYDRTDDQTVLIPLLEHVRNNVLTTEPLYRVVGRHHQQFERLVETLEALADQPDFWQGIDSAA